MYEIDHVGIAVSNIDQELSNYHRLLGFELHSRETISDQHVEVAFIKLPNTMIELIAPISAMSKIHKFIEKRGSGGLHHLCYKVADIEAELANLSSAGAKLIDSVPRSGAHNTLIAFVHPESFGGVLTELCQYR